MRAGVEEARPAARARRGRSTPGPVLVASVGVTHTEIAAVSEERGPARPVAERRYPTGGYEGLADLARAFLDESELEVEAACFSLPCLVSRGGARLDAPPWHIDEAGLARNLAVRRVWLLNDMVAAATAIPLLEPAELGLVKDGEPAEGGAIVLLVPGERLSVGLLVHDADAASGYRALPSAANRAVAAPMTPGHLELLRGLWHGFEHASFEHVPSQASIHGLYEFLRDAGGVAESAQLAAALPSARDRTRIVLDAACDRFDPDPLSRSALDLYLQILGAQTANVALTVLATGGIYLAGRLARRLRNELVSPAFLEPLLWAGMASEPLERVPVFVARRDLVLLGAAHEALRRCKGGPGPAS